MRSIHQVYDRAEEYLDLARGKLKGPARARGLQTSISWWPGAAYGMRSTVHQFASPLDQLTELTGWTVGHGRFHLDIKQMLDGKYFDPIPSVEGSYYSGVGFEQRFSTVEGADPSRMALQDEPVLCDLTARILEWQIKVLRQPGLLTTLGVLNEEGSVPELLVKKRKSL